MKANAKQTFNMMPQEKKEKIYEILKDIKLLFTPDTKYRHDKEKRYIVESLEEILSSISDGDALEKYEQKLISRLRHFIDFFECEYDDISISDIIKDFLSKYEANEIPSVENLGEEFFHKLKDNHMNIQRILLKSIYCTDPFLIWVEKELCT